MGAVLCKCLSVFRSFHNLIWNQFSFFLFHFFKRRPQTGSSKSISSLNSSSGNGNGKDGVVPFDKRNETGTNTEEMEKEGEREREREKEGAKKLRSNNLIRAIKDMTVYERTLLSMALVFLGINAYTNLNFPRIMGECIESNDLNYMSCSYLDKLLQKGNFLRNWKINSSSLQTLFHYFPYFLAGGIASYFRIFFTNKCVKSIECRLKKNVHKKILMEDNEEFRAFKSSDYLINCTFNEIKYCSKELITSITQMLRYLNSIIGGMVSMMLISSYLTKFCVFLVPSYGFFVLLILKKINNVKMETNKMDEKQMERFSDILQKRNIVSLFGNEYYENKYFSKKLKKIDKLNEKYLNAEALFYCFLNVGTNLVICSVLCFGKRELRNNNISHGQLISFIAYSSMLGLGIVGMLKLKKEINVLQMSLHKIYEILDFSQYTSAKKSENKDSLKNSYKIEEFNIYGNAMNKNKADAIEDGDAEVISPTRNKTLENNETLAHDSSEKEMQNGNVNRTYSTILNEGKCCTRSSRQNAFPEDIKGSIKFENVNFSYNCFGQTNKNYVLKNINFEIKEHEKVAIIGKSGSGKTTLWKLLTQEYEYDGTIYVDMYNLKDINKTYFKKKIISISEQECTILNRSLYENLLYGLLPIKIGSRNETPELIFDHIDKNRLLYQKMRGLVETIGNKEETELPNNSLSLMEEEDIMCIMQNCSFKGTQYEYLKDKCHSYLKKKNTLDAPIFNEEEQNFMKKRMKELLEKNIIPVPKRNGKASAVISETKKENTVSGKIHLSNEDHIMNRSILKCYKNKLNEINASIEILCKELDLNGLISSLPQEIQSPIQNNSISSGQKQRVAIIRSLMKNTPIYVFDEITSALDDSNVEKVFQTINSLIPDKTVIYITHSAKILNYMDKIIVVDDGEIALIGTYEEIKNDSRYLNVFPSHSAAI